jgi:hypothetical protein
MVIKGIEIDIIPQGECHCGALRKLNCCLLNGIKGIEIDIIPQGECPAERFGRVIVL